MRRGKAQIPIGAPAAVDLTSLTRLPEDTPA